MNEQEQLNFAHICFSIFRMSTSDIEIMLMKYGVDPCRDSFSACMNVLREHVGEKCWQQKANLVQVQTAA